MNILSELLNFIKDKSFHISYKITFIILGVTFLLIVNDWFGLTRNYQINSSLNQIEQLNRIDSSILKNNQIQNKLQELTFRVANSKPYMFNVMENIKSLSNNNDNYSQKSPIVTDWYDISAMSLTYIFIFFILFTIISILFSSSNWSEKKNSLLGAITIGILIFGIGRIYKFLLLLIIPVFTEMLWINHILNVGIQVGIISYLVIRARKSKSK